jgi:hypothetical protein
MPLSILCGNGKQGKKGMEDLKIFPNPFKLAK